MAYRGPSGGAGRAPPFHARPAAYACRCQRTCVEVAIRLRRCSSMGPASNLRGRQSRRYRPGAQRIGPSRTFAVAYLGSGPRKPESCRRGPVMLVCVMIVRALKQAGRIGRRDYPFCATGQLGTSTAVVAVPTLGSGPCHPTGPTHKPRGQASRRHQPGVRRTGPAGGQSVMNTEAPTLDRPISS
jgi:hypothetical protein